MSGCAYVRSCCITSAGTWSRRSRHSLISANSTFAHSGRLASVRQAVDRKPCSAEMLLPKRRPATLGIESSSYWASDSMATRCKAGSLVPRPVARLDQCSRRLSDVGLHRMPCPAPNGCPNRSIRSGQCRNCLIDRLGLALPQSEHQARIAEVRLILVQGHGERHREAAATSVLEMPGSDPPSTTTRFIAREPVPSRRRSAAGPRCEPAAAYRCIKRLAICFPNDRQSPDAGLLEHRLELRPMSQRAPPAPTKSSAACAGRPTSSLRASSAAMIGIASLCRQPLGGRRQLAANLNVRFRDRQVGHFGMTFAAVTKQPHRPATDVRIVIAKATRRRDRSFNSSIKFSAHNASSDPCSRPVQQWVRHRTCRLANPVPSIARRRTHLLGCENFAINCSWSDSCKSPSA